MNRTSLLLILLIFLTVTAHAQDQIQTVDRDTVYYELETEMIDTIRVMYEESMNRYVVSPRLKEEFHDEYEKLTGENISNFLGIIFEENLVRTSMPVIRAAISNGGLPAFFFETEDEAIELRDYLLGESETDG